MADALYAMALCEAGDHPQAARKHLEESLEITTALGHTLKIARTHNLLGEVARSQSNLEAALAHYRAGLAAVESIPGSWFKQLLLLNLGIALVELGDSDAGLPALLGVADRAHDARLYNVLAPALGALAAACATRGDHRRAARLLGSSARIYAEADRQPDPVDRVLPERAREAARAALGDSVFEKLIEQGQDLPIDKLLDGAASGEVDTGGAQVSRWEEPARSP